MRRGRGSWPADDGMKDRSFGIKQPRQRSQLILASDWIHQKQPWSIGSADRTAGRVEIRGTPALIMPREDLDSVTNSDCLKC